MNLNFFCEKHGKNKRDSHFANISKFLEAESLVRQLKSSKDIVDAIHCRQEYANRNKNGILVL